MEKGITVSKNSRPTLTVGLLGAEMDQEVYEQLGSQHMANVRLAEIERRILLIEGRLNDQA